jgi:hypothetical protein
MLFEAGDGSFNDVALPVAHWINQGRPPAPDAPAGSGGLLIGPLGDGVGDPPLAQQPPAGGVAVAAVGDQVGGALAGRPELGLGTRMVSSSGSSWVLSWRWPAVTNMASGRPAPSQARWSLVVSPPRLRPSAWSWSASVPT